jgi:Secretion system C-terminal sorting domain
MKKKISHITLLVLLPFFGVSQNPQGFFLNDHAERTFTVPLSTPAEKTDKATTVDITVHFSDVITPVSKYLFGNNANIWMTQMVDQPALMNNITKLKPNIIRFPGGSLSGVYFWNAQKNQPPADAPAQIWDGSTSTFKDAGYWYGKNTEGWTLSVENYYLMLQQTGNTGMITTNYDYARYSSAKDPVASAAHHAAEWVRYDNGRTKFWEVGNESNGTWQPAFRINQAANQDGQPPVMSGELYGKHFKVFADSMRKAATEIGKTIYIGAQLLEKVPESWQNDTDKNWNTGVFQATGNSPDYYIIHSYYTPYHTNANAAEILSTASTVTQNMMTYLHQGMAAAGVSKKPIALTEYNIFSTGSKQQASFINGMHTTIVLAELIKNKYGMAARWDLANGWENGNDHGMFSQGDDGTAKWTPRATFYYMHYFQKYFGDQMVNTSLNGSAEVLAYASRFSSGESGIVLVNKGTTEQVANIAIENFGFGDNYYIYALTGGADNGEFSLKVSVNGNQPSQAIGGPSYFESIPAWAIPIQGGIKVRLQPRSVQFVVVEAGDNVITSSHGESADLMEIYPNPVNGNFSLQVPVLEESRLSILDLSGREIFVKTVYPIENKVSLESRLPAGIYVVRVKGKSKTSFGKILVR